MTPKERQAVWTEKSVLLLDEFKTWLNKSALQVTLSMNIGKVINYSLNQWVKLIRYTEDERLNIDNNRSERTLKPFVIGRKAWLFSQTANATNASTVL